jgi:hypothetical protein
MGKINDARKALLTSQLEHAIVEQAEEPGYFKVFVPGAVREHNVVAAKDEDEAKSKVKTVLESKINQLSESEPTGNVEVQPDNLKLKVKGKVKSIPVEEGQNG